MSDGFGVDPDRIAFLTERIGAAGEELAAELDQLVGVLEYLGESWGDDDLGRAFSDGTGGAPGFREAREALLHGAGLLVAALGEVQHRGARMARSYQRTEQDVTDRFRNGGLG